MVASVFVYGTLKRRQSRETMWPAKPISVTAGWTRGFLYAGPSYPAMAVGNDRVLGECWRFGPADMDSVLKTLDQIEGTNQPGCEDLYQRFETEVFAIDGKQLGTAWVYHYAIAPERHGFVRQIPKSASDYVVWPDTDSV